MSSESQFQSERKKAFEDNKKLKQKYIDVQDDISAYDQKLWELHMDCYMEGKEKCVQMYNQAFLQWNKLSRRWTDIQNCIKKCEELKDPTSRLKEDILNQKHLDCYRKSFECERGCSANGLKWLEEEKDFLKQSWEKMRDEFYPGSKK